ncbi:ABC-type transport system periplasmic component [Corynebacterium suranareeae]|uniref:ABC-type transport system periplasmic component n=1 Tax=Corynebacterium suranareeae TaxID=2506452 RepID=A0A160PQ62_9CORY|nr:ABC transporter substrate-binding protein [Corynebacterium suranareeae]BAU95664.1 ABC-type transport system periplasmic component [Corynebacterium suranareeae]
MEPRLCHSTFVRIVSALLGVVLLTSCVPSPPKSFTHSTAVLRYRTSDINLSVVELAAALGYLENIELQVVGTVQGGTEAIQSLKSDEIDFSTIAFNGLIMAQVATGTPIKAIAACSGMSKDATSALLVQNGSEIAEIADLVGKTIGMNIIGSLGSAMMALHFQQSGLTPSEISSITLQPIAEEVMVDRLLQGQVDAIWVSDNTKERALATGNFAVLTEDVNLLGSRNTDSLVVSHDLIEKDPETISHLVDGVSRAIEFEQTHTSEEVRAVYFDYLERTNQDSRISAFQHWRSLGVSTRGGLINDRDFSIWSDWVESQIGPIDINLDNFYTNEFNPYHS